MENKEIDPESIYLKLMYFIKKENALRIIQTIEKEYTPHELVYRMIYYKEIYASDQHPYIFEDRLSENLPISRLMIACREEKTIDLHNITKKDLRALQEYIKSQEEDT